MGHKSGAGDEGQSMDVGSHVASKRYGAEA